MAPAPGPRLQAVLASGFYKPLLSSNTSLKLEDRLVPEGIRT
jgi:hypothetical protein